MLTLADLIASPYISYIVAAIGAAILVLCNGNKKMSLIGLWLIADFICDFVVTGFAEYWSYGDSTAYYYLYASTAILFSYYTIKRQEIYGRLIPIIFTLIAISSVVFCLYRYEMVVHWNEWGELMYNGAGSMIDGIYLFFVVALEALMIMQGFRDVPLNTAVTR